TVGRHPGTNQPASFSSDVFVDDVEKGVKGTRTISMNEPLVHRGWTFYQSSYVEGSPMTSIFQVTYDPGGRIAYLGFFGFTIGLFCVMWFRSTRPKTGSRGEGDPAGGDQEPEPDSKE
ncbi:MAG: cytochrome c biogenesis protein ResB, partial [Candidatus Riflebacteria bacterium]|nr:cytochrome c biogenesis protein ResB [Candidatus Riflebacteria bacterium]